MVVWMLSKGAFINNAMHLAGGQTNVMLWMEAYVKQAFECDRMGECVGKY